MDKSDFSTSRATTLTNRTSRECQLSYHIFLGYTETAMRRREMIRGALFWLCFPLFTGSALLTGFVVDDESVWGRPVGVTVAPDGSLLVSDDGSGSIWRITYMGK